MNPIEIPTSWLNAYGWVNLALSVLIFMTLVYSLLIFRQARQMTTVLPTPLSPPVHLSVVLYCIITVIACFLAVGVVIASF